MIVVGPYFHCLYFNLNGLTSFYMSSFKQMTSINHSFIDFF